MFARVSTFEATSESIAVSIDRTSEVLEKAEALSGFKGAYYLVDRGSGKSIAVTLWNSAEAMRDSEDAANQIRNDEATADGSHIVSVEHYEVAAAELR